MINEKYIHSEITAEILSVAFEVHKIIGVELNDNHLAQAINYLEAFNLEVGLLINFGSKSLQYKRVIHPGFLNQKISKII